MTLQSAQLRQFLRKQRRLLSPYQQRQFENQALKKLLTSPRFKQAQSVGLYLDAFGEIKTQKIIESCFSLKKTVYLPMICNMNKQLYWIKISQHLYRNKRFNLHRLKMLEPMSSRGVHVSHLDLLIMPLLACDSKGSRMGMGGGFYDRTLASAPVKPYRLGLGHDFQYLDIVLERQHWDQPLDAFISPSKFIRFRPK